MSAPTDASERRTYLDGLAVQVRDRQSGWEGAWEALVTALIPDLQRVLAGHRSAIPGGPEGLEEALSSVLYYWQSKISAGTLLRNWDTTSPIAGYLCHRIAVKIGRQSVQRLVSSGIGGDEGVGAMDERSSHSRDASHSDRPAQAPAAIHPSEAACSFMPLTAAGVTQMHSVAGLQLFRKLDWHQQPGPQVAASMADFLAAVDQPWEEALADAHERAQIALSQREHKLLNQLCNDGKGVSPRAERTLQQKIIKLRVEQMLHPIGPLQMMDLTGASRNVCDQHRSRWRRQHRDLVAWHADGILGDPDAGLDCDQEGAS
ncbi:MAG: hypothetical protein EA402_11795 [Planctomycetota bacterium]|nr:MAG: hypothetical protein EA402_11795 [Planctomycetota bacterium]